VIDVGNKVVRLDKEEFEENGDRSEVEDRVRGKEDN